MSEQERQDNTVDRLLEDIEAEKAARAREEEQIGEALRVDDSTADRIQQERRNKVAGFRLELNLDEDPEHTAVQAEETAVPAGTADGEPSQEEAAPTAPEEGGEDPASGEGEESDAPEEPEDSKAGKKKKKKDKTTWGCIRGILYAVLVLGASGVLAYFIITGCIDLVGLNKSDQLKDVEIPMGASTQQVAEVLKENGLIDQPLIFRLYSRLTKADGTYQPGTFTLSANMGYADIISELQNAKPREVVSVTVPEGSTIDDIAELLEEANVCTPEEFYHAVVQIDYTNDYAFIKEIPTADQGEQYEGRVYTLEGYMFPDTYEFYTESAGETVVRKFLDNFDRRVDAQVRSAISAKGMTLDEAIIIASIIQGEAAKSEDMLLVSRVLFNRLENPNVYPQLQCDSTRDYVQALTPSVEGIEITNVAYDTYKRKGLPVGAINNPGMEAILAAINPSEDEEAQEYFFFATDYSTGITYFSKTYAEHEKTCRKYKIGIHANG